jgi:hypothetical protein
VPKRFEVNVIFDSSVSTIAILQHPTFPRSIMLGPIRQNLQAPIFRQLIAWQAYENMYI